MAHRLSPALVVWLVAALVAQVGLPSAAVSAGSVRATPGGAPAAALPVAAPHPFDSSLPTPTRSAPTATPAPTSAPTASPAPTVIVTPIDRESAALPFLSLAAVAWPDAAAAGGVVNLRWEVENLGDQPVVGLALRADLPAGLVVTPADVAPPLSYDPAAKRLGWIVPALAPNARQGATVAARVAGARVGDVATVNGELALEDGRRVAASGAAVRILAPALRPSRVGPAGGTVELEDGRVTLTFAAGVVERPVTVWARPLGRPADAPGNILRAHEFSVRDQGDAEIHTFSQPVTLTVRYPEGEPACGRLFVRDEMTGLWEMLPTVWDAAAGALVARAPHLSTTGEGNNFAPEVMPSLRGLQTDLFSGAASYAYRVSVPPGRGGTAPGVTLGFSSRSRLEDAGHSSVTGAGWKLSADSFIYGTPWLTGSAPNTWRVAGAAFSEGGTGGAPYLKEAPQWRIQYAGAGADAYAPDGTRYHFEAALHDWWCQGTTWRQRTDKWALQYVLDPMSNRVDYIYDTDLLDNDSDSDLPINPLHVDTNPAYYGGLLTDSSPPAAARARTVRIAAPCANDGSGGNEDIHYLAQINLARISYNGGKSTIDFTYAVTRTDAALSDRSDISSWAHYTTRLLTAVKVRQDGSLIAAYKLAYDFYDDAQGRADKRVYALRSVGRCSDQLPAGDDLCQHRDSDAGAEQRLRRHRPAGLWPGQRRRRSHGDGHGDQPGRDLELYLYGTHLQRRYGGWLSLRHRNAAGQPGDGQLDRPPVPRWQRRRGLLGPRRTAKRGGEQQGAGGNHPHLAVHNDGRLQWGAARLPGPGVAEDLRSGWSQSAGAQDLPCERQQPGRPDVQRRGCGRLWLQRHGRRQCGAGPAHGHDRHHGQHGVGL